AAEYRQRFHADVVVDLFCYRKYGHNEGDEPRFTQPQMYAAIDKKRTIREVYVDSLVKTGKITVETAKTIEENRKAFLDEALEEAKTGSFDLVPSAMGGLWTNYVGGRDADTPDADTRVARPKL